MSHNFEQKSTFGNTEFLHSVWIFGEEYYISTQANFNDIDAELVDPFRERRSGYKRDVIFCLAAHFPSWVTRIMMIMAMLRINRFRQHLVKIM